MDYISVVTPPSDAVITLSQAKLHLRVPYASEDTVISDLIDAAVSEWESETGTYLLARTIAWRTAGWPANGIFYLPAAPVTAVGHIKYYDSTGALSAAFSSNDWSLDGGKLNRYPRITLRSGKQWPTAELQPGYPIEIQMTAGVASADIPDDIKAAVKVRMGQLFWGRDGAVDPHAQRTWEAMIRRHARHAHVEAAAV